MRRNVRSHMFGFFAITFLDSHLPYWCRACCQVNGMPWVYVCVCIICSIRMPVVIICLNENNVERHAGGESYFCVYVHVWEYLSIDHSGVCSFCLGMMVVGSQRANQMNTSLPSLGHKVHLIQILFVLALLLLFLLFFFFFSFSFSFSLLFSSSLSLSLFSSLLNNTTPDTFIHKGRLNTNTTTTHLEQTTNNTISPKNNQTHIHHPRSNPQCPHPADESKPMSWSCKCHFFSLSLCRLFKGMPSYRHNSLYLPLLNEIHFSTDSLLFGFTRRIISMLGWWVTTRSPWSTTTCKSSMSVSTARPTVRTQEHIGVTCWDCFTCSFLWKATEDKEITSRKFPVLLNCFFVC